LLCAMNEADQKRGTNRREFMRDGFRYALLTGLAAVSATLFQRSGGQLSGQTCSNRGICSSCTAFTNCGLPQALSAKEFRSPDSRHDEAKISPGEKSEPSCVGCDQAKHSRLT
jgi:hypothetical protein